VPSVLLWETELEAEMWDNETLGGLVPTLFADNTEAARTAFLENRAKAHSDLLKLMKGLYMPELISMTEAAAMVKKPRQVNIYLCYKYN